MLRTATWKVGWECFPGDREVILHRAAVAGGLGQAMSTGARFAADMGSHLARGSMDVTKAHLSGAGERASQTPGGKVASVIRANMEQPVFKGNRFTGSTDTTLDPEAEAEAFVNSK